MRYHVFGPVAVLAVAILMLGAVLPANSREKTSNWLCKIEKRLAVSQLTFVTLWIYWAVRLINMNEKLLMLLRNYDFTH